MSKWLVTDSPDRCSRLLDFTPSFDAKAKLQSPSSLADYGHDDMASHRPAQTYSSTLLTKSIVMVCPCSAPRYVVVRVLCNSLSQQRGHHRPRVLTKLWTLSTGTWRQEDRPSGERAEHEVVMSQQMIGARLGLSLGPLLELVTGLQLGALLILGWPCLCLIMGPADCTVVVRPGTLPVFGRGGGHPIPAMWMLMLPVCKFPNPTPRLGTWFEPIKRHERKSTRYRRFPTYHAPY